MADAALFHRDAVEHVGQFHRALVVRDDDELDVIGEHLNEPDEAQDVAFVERRVHFIEHAERAGLGLEDCEEQRYGRERSFAAG